MIKSQVAYEDANKPVAAGKIAFKGNFLYVVLDKAIESLNQRCLMDGKIIVKYSFFMMLRNY